MQKLFEILFLINWQPYQNFLGEIAVLWGNLSCYISRTEGQRKFELKLVFSTVKLF